MTAFTAQPVHQTTGFFVIKAARFAAAITENGPNWLFELTCHL